MRIRKYGTRWYQYRARRKHAGPIRYVAVYSVGLMYGGPEEGGWWYDAGELVKWRSVNSTASARRLARTWKRECDRINATENSATRYSVNGGDDLDVTLTKTRPWPYFPLRRPRYE